ncbi:MAG TPA: 2,3-bisphosphoglycerate-dependent phosphoglycerate mutase [Chlamydiales bacterium]|nr:2,3-bisphosphoglycerate-dependent phosphoglycerate mutase [Chlamydiales bacterium]
MSKLIIMRHGQSIWNQRNLFTGWVDVPLSEKGVEEALNAGKEIMDEPIDIVYVSTLIRSQTTAVLALLSHHTQKTPVMQHPHNEKESKWGKVHSDKTEKEIIPMIPAWELNERMYGDLQGLNKAETAEKYGKEQVHIWRRSFDVAPPHGESLKMTSERTIPYFKERILPHLEKGENVLISAHGNSLRSIVMFIENLSGEEVVSLEIPTGKPIIYEYNQGTWSKS